MKAQTGRKVKFLNATGVSDGRYYADDGIEIINFGPGSGAQGHAANESVPIAEMVEAADIQLERGAAADGSQPMSRSRW